jgi:hypothetical protein
MRAIVACLLMTSTAASLASCSKEEPKKAAAASSIPIPEATALPPPPQPIPAAPRDLDVAALERDLGCTKTSQLKACAILKEFSQAQRFAAKTPSGQGRWIGKAFSVEKNVETARHLVLWAKTVPLSQVGPGDMPVKAGFDFIPDGLKLQSEKLMRALVRSADPPESNPAFQFAKAFVPPTPRTLANTAGPSVHLTSEQSVYLRFAPPRKVYLVNPAPSTAAAGDGVYAELWLGDW